MNKDPKEVKVQISSKCKGPEARVCLERSRNNKELCNLAKLQRAVGENSVR